MKETTRTIQVKAYTDDEGKPVCGDCIVKWCKFCGGVDKERGGYPGPSCPVWHGDRKGEEGRQVLMQLSSTPDSKPYKYTDEGELQEAKGWYTSEFQEAITFAFNAAREYKEG